MTGDGERGEEKRKREMPSILWICWPDVNVVIFSSTQGQLRQKKLHCVRLKCRRLIIGDQNKDLLTLGEKIYTCWQICPCQLWEIENDARCKKLKNENIGLEINKWGGGVNKATKGGVKWSKWLQNVFLKTRMFRRRVHEPPDQTTTLRSQPTAKPSLIRPLVKGI